MKVKRKSITLDRRAFIKSLSALSLGLCAPIGCTRHRYVRPAGELDLGAVKELLYRVVHIRERAILLFRDIDGWSALSARCTYRGCDLTFQEEQKNLICACCHTRFELTGVPYSGYPATELLPWVGLSYKDGHIYADPGVIKPRSYRFTTPEIEEAIRELRRRIKEEGLSDEIKIPEILLGSGDGEVGGMFLEDDPNFVHELEMIR